LVGTTPGRSMAWPPLRGRGAARCRTGDPGAAGAVRIVRRVHAARGRCQALVPGADFVAPSACVVALRHGGLGLVTGEPGTGGAAHLGSWAIVGPAGVLLVTLIVTALGWGAVVALRAAYRRGRRAGQDAERRELLRVMHDTVLQTLEAVAGTASRQHLDPNRAGAALRELGHRAAREAVQLRHLLSDVPDGDLDADLRRLAAHFAGKGLAVEVTRTDVDPGLSLPPRTARALRGAVHEALTNVVRHAGCDRAVLNVHQSGDGLRVTVRDYGAGFDADPSAFGFGLRQSVTARIREAGGRCQVRSRPGEGTCITLDLPTSGDPPAARPPAGSPTDRADVRTVPADRADVRTLSAARWR